MHQPRTQTARLGRHRRRGLRIDLHRRGDVALGLVYRCICRGIHDNARRGLADNAHDRVRIAQVAIGGR